MSNAATRPKHARPLTTLTPEQLATVTGGGGFKPGNPGYIDDDSVSLEPGDPASYGATVGGFKPGGPG